jgi:hypothetical protein
LISMLQKVDPKAIVTVWMDGDAHILHASDTLDVSDCGTNIQINAMNSEEHIDGERFRELQPLAFDRKISQTLESVGNDALLAEVARRGMLTDLHEAVGALYDNLATNGILDSETNTSSFLAYRLRREDAKLSDNHGGYRTANYWQQKIDAIDSDVERSTSPRG